MKLPPGSTALVTGASAGIGRRIAQHLAARGVRVVLAARSADRLEAAVREIRGAGGEAWSVPTDVSDRSALARLVEHATRAVGRIDLLVNNAGIEAFARFDELDPDDIARTIEVNLTGAVQLARLVLPQMLAARQGHVVNVSSTAGKRGPAFGAVYGATKAGLIAFTQGLRTELHGTGVSASVVCPGFVEDGGIYERLEDRAGRSVPPWIGTTTSAHVARAVVRVVERDLPEAVVNFPPFRPLAVFAEAFPAWGDRIVRWATRRWLQRVADSRGDSANRSQRPRRAA